ncbi:MBL fold metallo-hydrolase [Erythrobacter sp. EC-HK427]|uniref:MBL fold metallo-hydrolase n=1 Tax=Erythrobacter sp. EC-HK427 TaxID=2038396 RepID=UPI001251B281|nr:MBL fold metallo-hydrolase [Erythrobacter sp. EC-HK427]VVT09616.1 Pyrroloquinoline quinone biosynthesis protein PqqB [Erythrobacter sp. EC-HK427]
MKRAITLGLAVSSLALASPLFAQEADAPCDYELVVLGAGQDAGAPQIGNAEDTGPGLLPSSLGLIDRMAGRRYLFDATPAITEQLAMLDAIEPPAQGLGVDGVFLTHAHIGHYLGLAYFGREAAGASGVPVYAMPRMAEFLRSNGPWSQLVELGNIRLQEMVEMTPLSAGGRIFVSAVPVPHRDEFSETAAFVFYQPELGNVLYLPDIDYWQEVEGGNFLRQILPQLDYAFIDATFWDDNELPGRDMSEIPHPRVTATMDLLQDLPASERAKVHFIHYNHTNSIRDPDSPESREVEARGFNVARRGDRFCL